MKYALILLSLTMLLAGCERSSNTPTADENRRLDEAANLLDEAPANLDAINDSGLANTANAGSRP